MIAIIPSKHTLRVCLSFSYYLQRKKCRFMRRVINAIIYIIDDGGKQCFGLKELNIL